jgi:hypothetical protein
LDVASGEVVEDGVARDVLAGALGRDTGALLADEHPPFELVVELLGVSGDMYLSVGSHDGAPVGLVVGRSLVEGPVEQAGDRAAGADDSGEALVDAGEGAKPQADDVSHRLGVA